jgi:hypothetical protein
MGRGPRCPIVLPAIAEDPRRDGHPLFWSAREPKSGQDAPPFAPRRRAGTNPFVNAPTCADPSPIALSHVGFRARRSPIPRSGIQVRASAVERVSTAVERATSSMGSPTRSTGGSGIGSNLRRTATGTTGSARSHPQGGQAPRSQRSAAGRHRGRPGGRRPLPTRDRLHLARRHRRGRRRADSPGGCRPTDRDAIEAVVSDSCSRCRIARHAGAAQARSAEGRRPVRPDGWSAQRPCRLAPRRELVSRRGTAHRGWGRRRVRAPRCREIGLVVGEEDLADQLAPAAKSGYLEDLDGSWTVCGETTRRSTI